MNELNGHLADLSKTLHDKAPGYVAEAETCLERIAEIDDPGSIRPLIDLLDDAAPDELMFSIVHMIEKWDDLTYSKAILESAESMLKSSPRWAQILHIRIMNSQSTADTYLTMLATASSSTRSAVRKIYESVGNSRPSLASKTTSILARLSE